MFPMQIAKRLGVAEALVRDETGAVGVEGESFSTWSHHAGLQAPILDVRRGTTGTVVRWGAQFTLNPAFCDKGAFLLGREDFFARFRVAFDPGDPLPTFSIS